MKATLDQLKTVTKDKNPWSGKSEQTNARASSASGLPFDNGDEIIITIIVIIITIIIITVSSIARQGNEHNTLLNGYVHKQKNIITKLQKR